MKKLKLGIIGLSEGNGHPYSWAAICNGYREDYMNKCPFPVIPKYLSENTYPTDFISNAEVTHIWTQDKTISKAIAQASKISNVVDNYTEMIGEVDAILLARDDAENHLKMSKKFLKAGLPVYIDKPLAINLEMANKIFSNEEYEGQIFSCSAMRFAKEVTNAINTINKIGKITHVDACVMKKWSTYSAHIIDPILRIIGNNEEIIAQTKVINRNSNSILLKMESGLSINLSSHRTTPCPISIRIFGETGYYEIIPQDTFFAFKATLQKFIQSAFSREPAIEKREMLRLVDWIERGM